MKSKIGSLLFVVLVFMLYGVVMAFVFIGIVNFTSPKIATFFTKVLCAIPFLYFLFQKTEIPLLSTDHAPLHNRRQVLWRLLGLGVLLAIIIKPLYYLFNPFLSLYADATLVEAIFRTCEALIVAPIVEEFFYRKWMFDYLEKKRISPVVICVLTSILFYLAHTDSYAVFIEFDLDHILSRTDTLITGFVYGLVYWKYRNIKYCIFLHFVNNLAIHLLLLAIYHISL